MQTDVFVILPQKSVMGQIGLQQKTTDSAYKTLYLLHGLSDDHTIWMRRTSIERYASQYGICVVMPCAGRSFYCDIKHGLAYYTYIAKELPKRIQEFFHVSPKREDTFVAGLSMGGYGALKLALREPETFCAGAGLSPCCDLDKLEFNDIFTGIFGEGQKTPDADNLSFLAAQQKNNPQKPRLYMAMGTDDFLYENAQPLRRQLAKDFDFTYFETKNDHNWAFWDGQIQEVLKWMFDKG